jgi:hypothetical protein
MALEAMDLALVHKTLVRNKCTKIQLEKETLIRGTPYSTREIMGLYIHMYNIYTIFCVEDTKGC